MNNYPPPPNSDPFTVLIVGNTSDCTIMLRTSDLQVFCSQNVQNKY